MNRERLLKAIEIMANHESAKDEKLVSCLKEYGYDHLEAEKLNALVPIAFGRRLLEKLGVTNLSDSISAKSKSGKWVDIPLEGQPIYVMALAIAKEAFMTGAVSRSAYEAVAFRSPEVISVNKALNEGMNVIGTSVASALIGLSAEDMGHTSWWHSIHAKFCRLTSDCDRQAGI